MGSIDADLGTTGAGDNSGRLRFNVRRGSDGTQQTKMVIDDSGKVGIGTMSPAERLHIVASATNAGALRIDGDQSAIEHRNSAGAQKF